MEPISAKLVLCARRRSQPLDAPSHLNLINALWANVIYSFFKQGSWGSERLNNSLKGTQLLSGKGKNNTWRCSTLGWCACSRWCQQELSSLTFIIHTNLYSSSTYGFHSRDPPLLGSFAGSALEWGWGRRGEGKEVGLALTHGRKAEKWQAAWRSSR